MKFLLFFNLPLLSGVCDEVWMGKTKYGILSYVLKELHHTFPGKVTSVQDTGFVEELLLHVEVVAPVAGLKGGGVVIKPGLDEASQGSQYNQQEEYGPANCLDRARTVSHTKQTNAITHHSDCDEPE